MEEGEERWLWCLVSLLLLSCKRSVGSPQFDELFKLYESPSWLQLSLKKNSRKSIIHTCTPKKRDGDEN